MSPWRARSTTAIKRPRLNVLWLIVPLLSFGGGAVAADSLDRMVAAVSAFDPTVEAITAAPFRQACGGDALCVAQLLVARSHGRARLEAAQHPDSDTIRWVKNEASLRDTGLDADGRRVLVVDGFGRKLVQELETALAGGSVGEALVLDLRGNRGGDFERMLRLAARFTGPVEKALALRLAEETRWIDLTADGDLSGTADLTLWVGSETASSGEVLAALLRRYAGARVLGETTAGKDYLLRIVPIDHDWRLLYPAETIVVPGESLEGGLTPDAPLSMAPSEGAQG